MHRVEELKSLRADVELLQARIERLNIGISHLAQDFNMVAFKAVVDPQPCIGCGSCEKACPLKAISVKTIASVDPERCMGCGRCVEVCPKGALSLRSETIDRFQNDHRIARRRPGPRIGFIRVCGS